MKQKMVSVMIVVIFTAVMLAGCTSGGTTSASIPITIVKSKTQFGDNILYDIETPKGVQCVYVDGGYKHGAGLSCNWADYNGN